MSSPLHAYAQNIQAQLEYLDALECGKTETWGLQDLVSQKISSARAALETDGVRVDSWLEQGRTDAPCDSPWEYDIEMLTFIASPIPKDGAALIRAVETGQTAHVEVLIKYGINLHASKTELMQSQNQKKGTIRRQITHKGRMYDDEPNFAIVTAASNGFVDIVRLIPGIPPPKAFIMGIAHVDVVRVLLPFVTTEALLEDGLIAAINADSLESARILLADSRVTARLFTIVFTYTFKRTFKMLQLFLEHMHLFDIECARQVYLFSQRFDAACEIGLSDNVIAILSDSRLRPFVNIRAGVISAIDKKHDELAFKMFEMLLKFGSTR